MSLQQYIEQAQTDCFTKHGVIFAFSNEQFEEQKQEGVKYASLGAGVICPVDSLKAFAKEHKNIVKDGISKDIKENGAANIVERELANYECYYSGDIEDCVDALKSYDFPIQFIMEVYQATRHNHD